MFGDRTRVVTCNDGMTFTCSLEMQLALLDCMQSLLPRPNFESIDMVQCRCAATRIAVLQQPTCFMMQAQQARIAIPIYQNELVPFPIASSALVAAFIGCKQHQDCLLIHCRSHCCYVCLLYLFEGINKRSQPPCAIVASVEVVLLQQLSTH